MSVPKRQVVDQPREQPSLEHAQQKAHRRNTSKAMRRAHTNRHSAPAEHEKRKPAARAELLEQDVAGHLEKRVGDEKDHEGDVELVVAHAGRVLHVVSSA